MPVISDLPKRFDMELRERIIDIAMEDYRRVIPEVVGEMKEIDSFDKSESGEEENYSYSADEDEQSTKLKKLSKKVKVKKEGEFGNVSGGVTNRCRRDEHTFRTPLDTLSTGNPSLGACTKSLLPTP